jgi:hypothetical protein
MEAFKKHGDDVYKRNMNRTNNASVEWLAIV